VAAREVPSWPPSNRPHDVDAIKLDWEALCTAARRLLRMYLNGFDRDERKRHHD